MRVPRDVSDARNRRAYGASSCSRISAMRDSGLSVLIVTMGDPVGQPYQGGTPIMRATWSELPRGHKSRNGRWSQGHDNLAIDTAAGR